MKGTSNLWGERWSKLTQNGMRNGVCSVTGSTSTQCDRNPAVRRFSIMLGGEGVRVGQALGYHLSSSCSGRRAVAVEVADGLAWFRTGTHAEYDEGHDQPRDRRRHQAAFRADPDRHVRI
ncbi:MAG: hypothetical protein IT529_13710 [Burkholderiales bacterium]|nr:hypothetical protein [Burkholderiales bacterium]